MYSTITKKKCKGNCGRFPKSGYDGYCYSCSPEEIKERQAAKTRKQIKDARQRLQNKVLALQPEKDEEKEQDLWYRMQMQSNEKVCDNCGLSLAHYNEWAWRSSQNHIVDKSPKNGCPSVATHPLNCNVLGMWCCHGQWGTNFENQSKMPCFAAAKEKFQLFMKDIHPQELKKVNPYLFQMEPFSYPIGTDNQKQYNKD